MHYFVRVLVSFSMLCVLTACGPVHEKKYSYSPPQGSIGRTCVAQCYTAKKHCERLCALRQQNCGMTAKKRARHNNGVASFANRGHNCNTACQCKPAFNTCYSACGGTVYEQ